MLPKFKRVLLKLSGESLMGDKNFGLDPNVLSQYSSDIKSITELNVQVAVVIGGGNIYRGMNEAETGIERAHGCLLYTSDAADERSSVDLGGRRIIKKKRELIS